MICTEVCGDCIQKEKEKERDREKKRERDREKHRGGESWSRMKGENGPDRWSLRERE